MGCVCLLTAQSRGFYCSIRWLPLISAGSWVPRDQDITGQDKVFLLEIVRREEEVGHRPPWTDPNCYRPTTKDEIKIEKITIKKYFVTTGGCNSFIGDLWNPSQRGNNFPNFEESNWEFRSSEFGHFLWETVEENILKYLRQSSPYHCLYTQLPDTQSFKSHWKCQFISLIDTLM